MQPDRGGFTEDQLGTRRTCRVWDGTSFVEVMASAIRPWRPATTVSLQDGDQRAPAASDGRAGRPPETAEHRHRR